MIDHGKFNVLGINVSAVDYEAAVQKIAENAADQQPLAVSALAVHGIMTGATDATHRFRLNQLDMIVPDGQPVRWALNLLHRTKLEQRVYGPTLMLETCARAARDGLPIFLFGGTRELLDLLRERLTQQFPGLEIAGTRASLFRCLTPEERDEVVREIRDSGARITFVGLGCPRQEVWAYEFREALSMPLLAVGAAFNFHAGLLPQAPARLQKLGLEWLYRLVQEPRRLWRRYLFLNPAYLTMLTLQWCRLRSFATNSGTQPADEVLYG